MSATWINCGFELEGQQINVAVRRLEPDERRRMAAEIAWFADGMLAAGTAPKPEGWPDLLDRILSQDVTITLDEARFGEAEDVWDQLVCRVFEAFVTANHLDPTIRRHLASAPVRSAS